MLHAPPTYAKIDVLLKIAFISDVPMDVPTLIFSNSFLYSFFQGTKGLSILSVLCQTSSPVLISFGAGEHIEIITVVVLLTISPDKIPPIKVKSDEVLVKKSESPFSYAVSAISSIAANAATNPDILPEIKTTTN